MTEQKKNKWYYDKKQLLLSIILFGLFFIMHYYKLDMVPKGLHVDEAGAAYDAYSLLHWGRDRALNYHPVYLVNFGRGQSALYAYSCIPFIYFMGLTVKAIRLPMLMYAVVLYLSTTRICNRVFTQKYMTRLAQIFLIILPYFTMQSRFGLDCNLLLPLSTLSLCVLIEAIIRGKKRWWALSGLCIGITLYTYALSYLIIPIFLLMIIGYLLWMKKITWTKIVILGVPILVLSAPLIATVIVNQFRLETIKTSWITIPSLPDYGGGEISFSHLYTNFLCTLKSILTVDFLPYNALEGFNTLYVISIPFVVIGFFYCLYRLMESLREHEFTLEIIPFLWGIAVLFLGCLLGGDGPNINKLNGIFFALLWMLIFGVVKTYLFIKKITKDADEEKCYGLSRELAKFKKAPSYFVGILGGMYLLMYACFSQYYFFQYSKDVYPQRLFEDPYKDVVAGIGSIQMYGGPTYIDCSYIEFLFSTEMDPFTYQSYKDGERAWGNITFSLPEEIDSTATYIVRRKNKEYLEKIRPYNFPNVEVGDYVVFYNR